VIEFAVFHNASSDLPSATYDGWGFDQGTLADTHRAAQRVIQNQVRQAVLAERLGFHYFFTTEHHFQVEGAERGSNPLVLGAALAMVTNRIRIGQMANILPWWHPIRLAEIAGYVDVLSGGRLEFGIGRGYQARESEVFGQLHNSTIQDQEKNRAYYEEAIDLILKAWTEPSISFHGEFFHVPPSWTKWGHPQTNAFFQQANLERSVDDVLKLGPPDAYSGGGSVTNTTTKLREVSVYPQPLQDPHPQVWSPVTTPRSVEFIARRGFNGYFATETNKVLKQAVETYHSLSEELGWPDFRNRGPFKRGWDCTLKRGVVPGRVIHVTEKGIGSAERIRAAAETEWSYYGPFGYFPALAAQGGEIPTRAKFEDIQRSGLVITGGKQQVIDEIMEVKEFCGFEDFQLGCWFEYQGLLPEEEETQMQYFAEEIMPVLQKECGGSPEFPMSTLDLSPGARTDDDLTPVGP
jgi:alkanesulfonate monooxygenase SsuD/methylene tetrahydromethanopterin reductase-like flavin-dependent oxidoreductase (luciferase family)